MPGTALPSILPTQCQIYINVKVGWGLIRCWSSIEALPEQCFCRTTCWIQHRPDPESPTRRWTRQTGSRWPSRRRWPRRSRSGSSSRWCWWCWKRKNTGNVNIWMTRGFIIKVAKNEASLNKGQPWPNMSFVFTRLLQSMTQHISKQLSVVFITGFFSQWEGVLGRYVPLIKVV